MNIYNFLPKNDKKGGIVPNFGTDGAAYKNRAKPKKADFVTTLFHVSGRVTKDTHGISA